LKTEMNHSQSYTAPRRPAHAGARAGADRSGNAKQHYERYVALAREKAQSGDHVEAENYYQHAEHFFRTLAIAAEAEKARQR
jgi:hypothetical protein